MTVELQVLGWAVLLAAVQLMLFAVPANRELTSEWLAGPRDGTPPGEMSDGTKRLQRAFLNHVEGLVMFTAAVVVVVGGGASSWFTETCAVAYLVARVAYVPLYSAGVRWVRSAVWAVGFFATCLMVVAALVG